MGYEDEKLHGQIAAIGAVGSAIGAGILAHKNKKKKVSKGAVALSVLSAAFVGGFVYKTNEMNIALMLEGGPPKGITVKNNSNFVGPPAPNK